MAIFKNLRV